MSNRNFETDQERNAFIHRMYEQFIQNFPEHKIHPDLAVQSKQLNLYIAGNQNMYDITPDQCEAYLKRKFALLKAFAEFEHKNRANRKYQELPVYRKRDEFKYYVEDNKLKLHPITDIEAAYAFDWAERVGKDSEITKKAILVSLGLLAGGLAINSCTTEESQAPFPSAPTPVHAKDTKHDAPPVPRLLRPRHQDSWEDRLNNNPVIRNNPFPSF